MSKKLFSNELEHETLSSKKLQYHLNRPICFSQINNTNNTKEKHRYKHLLSQDEIHKLKLDIIEKAKFSIHIISENKGTSVDSIFRFCFML